MPSHNAPFALCLLLLGAHAYAEAEVPPASSESTSPGTPATERAPLAERSQNDARALERQLQKNEQQPLMAGEESFLALWLPANVSEPKGAVILLPGDDESADWPQGIGPLRRKLPDAGWHSLSLSLPDPQGGSLPVRSADTALASQPAATQPLESTGEPEATEPADNAPVDSQAAPATSALDGDPEAQRKAHAQRVLARIEAGIAFAQQQQAQTIVLLGHGSGAYWAARFLAERQPANVQNLLLVAARLPDGFGPTLDELIPKLKLATGDFYYQEQTSARDAALERLQTSKRQKHPAYIQIALKALPGNPAAEQEQLYRRIRGWLMQHLQARAH